jgi:hypothetical protein
MIPDGNWVIRLDGRIHTVRATLPLGPDDIVLSVFVDGVLAFKKSFGLVTFPRELCQFHKDGHAYVVTKKGWWGSGSLELQVDGVKVEPTNDGALAAPPSGAKVLLPGMELVNTSVDSKVLKVEVDSEVITVPRGVKRTVRKSRTITRTLETTTTAKTGAKVGVNIGPLTAKIQGEIETRLGRTFQESEAVEQTVEIDGNTHQRFQLTWYDRFRTGEISYRENGTLKNARFLFREGTELEVSELK